jgi:DNA-binding NtrC family response regulator
MERHVTVAIIEDHPVVTEGVASWIRSDPGQRVRLVQTARDLTGLRAAPRPPADVIILDLELSGELVTTQIPGLVAAGYRVVAFSGHSDPAIVMETLDNGAHAYVSKEEGLDHLVEAVLAAAADRPYVTRSQTSARPGRRCRSRSGRRCCCGSRACRKHRSGGACRSARTQSGSTSHAHAPSTRPPGGPRRARTRCSPARSRTA